MPAAPNASCIWRSGRSNGAPLLLEAVARRTRPQRVADAPPARSTGSCRCRPGWACSGVAERRPSGRRRLRSPLIAVSCPVPDTRSATRHGCSQEAGREKFLHRQQGEAVGHERRASPAARRARRGRPSAPRRPRRRRTRSARRGRRGSSGRRGRRRRRRTRRRRSERHRLGVDADLLEQLAPGRHVVVLAGRHHPADGDVPPARPQVLGRRCAGARAARPALERDDDEHGAVAQALGAHPPPRHRRDDPVVGVDDVDELVAGPAASGTADGPRPVPTMSPCPSTPPPCARKPRTCSRPPSSCDASCTAGPRSATSCRVTQEHRPRRARRAAASTSRSTRRRAASPPCSPATGRARRSCCAATWTPCRCTRTPGSTSRRATTARCTPAATTPTRRCSPGAAKLLAGRRADLAGRVLFMFQPGEEGHHGARYMLEEGLLDVPDLADGTASPVTGAFALHITSALPSGWLSSRAGLDHGVGRHSSLITITGKGGHASEPHRTIDPIPVACEMVQALQMMVTRSIDVFDPAVRDRRQDHRRHDEQHHPRDGAHRGHDPRRQREDAGQGPRRHPPRRRRHRRRPRLRRRGRGRAGLPGDGQRRVVRRPRARPRRRHRRRRQGRAPAAPGDGRRGLELRAAAGAGGDDVPRRHAPDRNPATAAPNHSNRVLFDEQAMATGIATYAAVALDHLA